MTEPGLRVLDVSLAGTSPHDVMAARKPCQALDSDGATAKSSFVTSSPTRPTERTLKRLFALSGNRCAFPKCGSAIVQAETLVGEVCHIRAASPGGPRFEQGQSAEDRHAFENLILLCANHHAVVDHDPAAYSVERLLLMKADHEHGSTALADSEASAGATVISAGQSGGMTAHSISVHTANFFSEPMPATGPREAQAIALLAPELARVIAHQIHALDAAMRQFGQAVVGQDLPPDSWPAIVPRKPKLYPSATQVDNLSAAHSGLLAEFYNLTDEIDELIAYWRDSDVHWDKNAWNVLMQKIGRSIHSGLAAAEQFCPGRAFDLTMPSTGTLADRANHSLGAMERGLAAHIARSTQSATNRVPARPSAKPPRIRAPSDSRPTDEELRSKLHEHWWGLMATWPSFRDLPAVVSKPSALIHFTPAMSVRGEADLDLVAIDSARVLLQADGPAATGSSFRQWWAHGPTYRAAGHMPETGWATRFFRPGIVEWELRLGRRLSGDEKAVVHLEVLEDLVVSAADKSLDFLERIGIEGPTLASLVLYSMELAEIPLKGRTPNPFPAHSFVCPTVLLPARAREAGAHLKPMLDAAWLEVGNGLGSPSYPGGVWRGYAR